MLSVSSSINASDEQSIEQASFASDVSDTARKEAKEGMQSIVKASRKSKPPKFVMTFRKCMYFLQIFYLLFEIPRNSWSFGALLGTDSNYRPIIRKASRLVNGNEPLFLRHDIPSEFQYLSFLLVDANRQMDKKEDTGDTYFAHLSRKWDFDNTERCDKLIGNYTMPTLERDNENIGLQLMNYVYRRETAEFTNIGSNKGDFKHLTSIAPTEYGPDAEVLLEADYRIIYRDLEYIYFSGYARNNSENIFSTGRTFYRTTCDKCLISAIIERFYCVAHSVWHDAEATGIDENTTSIEIISARGYEKEPLNTGVTIGSNWQYSLADTLRHIASVLSLFVLWLSYRSIPYVVQDGKRLPYASATNYTNPLAKTSYYTSKLLLLKKAVWMRGHQGIVYPMFITHNVSVIVFMNMLANLLDVELTLMWIKDNMDEFSNSGSLLNLITAIQFSLHFVPIVCGTLKTLKIFVRVKMFLFATTHYFYFHVVGVLVGVLTAEAFWLDLFRGHVTKTHAGENLCAVMNVNMTFNQHTFYRDCYLFSIALWQVVAGLLNFGLRMTRKQSCYTAYVDYCSMIVNAATGIQYQNGAPRGTQYELATLQFILDLEAIEPIKVKHPITGQHLSLAPKPLVEDAPDGSDHAYLAYTRGRCCLTIQKVLVEDNLNVQMAAKTSKYVTYVLQPAIK